MLTTQRPALFHVCRSRFFYCFPECLYVHLGQIQPWQGSVRSCHRWSVNIKVLFCIGRLRSKTETALHQKQWQAAVRLKNTYFFKRQKESQLKVSWNKRPKREEKGSKQCFFNGTVQISKQSVSCIVSNCLIKKVLILTFGEFWSDTKIKDITVSSVDFIHKLW